ncbi:putative vegetative cell wall protein gp1 [Phaeomoniella chlamydospora]|uniref:Putative vegetative cell wall protein gp1 n=1 Tax=Phaeomoniella chlamydospora TaxID=158046 RepID=A0A0G2DUU9_PHACM|nr:putative vegetative cell wall protein gp1 [Phaeomoniella chlamydospora]
MASTSTPTIQDDRSSSNVTVSSISIPSIPLSELQNNELEAKSVKTCTDRSSDSSLSPVPSDVGTPSPLKRKRSRRDRDEGDEEVSAVSKPEASPRPPVKRLRLDRDLSIGSQSTTLKRKTYPESVGEDGVDEADGQDNTTLSKPLDSETQETVSRLRSSLKRSGAPPPKKKVKIVEDPSSDSGGPACRTRRRTTLATTVASGGLEDIRASTPASVASSTPKRSGRGGRGGSRGGGRGGRGGRGGHDRSGNKKDKDADKDPGWPKDFTREYPDTEETLALKKRRQELKAFFRHLAPVHSTALETLAARDLTKICRKQDAHTTAPGYDDTLNTLQQKFKERQAILKAEYEVKVRAEMRRYQDAQNLSEQGFRDHVRNAHAEHLSFAKRDLQRLEETMTAVDDDDHTVAGSEDLNHQHRHTDPLQAQPAGENRTTRGYNSHAVRQIIPTALGSYDPEEFEEHARRRVMFTDIIEPILAEQERKQAEAEQEKAAQLEKIVRQNLDTLVQAAESNVREERPAPPSLPATPAQPTHQTPTPSAMQQAVYAVDLSRLADAAESLRQAEPSPPKRQARKRRATSKRPGSPNPTRVNGFHTLPPPPPPPPPPALPTPQQPSMGLPHPSSHERRHSSTKPSLQPSPMITGPNTHTSLPPPPPSMQTQHYPPIQIAPILNVPSFPYPAGHSPYLHQPPMPGPHLPPPQPQQFHHPPPPPHHHLFQPPQPQPHPLPTTDMSPFRPLRPQPQLQLQSQSQSQPQPSHQPPPTTASSPTTITVASPAPPTTTTTTTHHTLISTPTTTNQSRPSNRPRRNQTTRPDFEFRMFNPNPPGSSGSGSGSGSGRRGRGGGSTTGGAGGK